MPEWYALTPDQVVAELKSQKEGLSTVEAKRRLLEVGPNQLIAESRVTAWALLAEQFKNVLIIVLLVATGLSVAMGHGLESLVIAVIVLFAVVLGFFQEYRAERSIEQLKKLAAPLASVLRDDQECKIAASEVVPGDVIKLQTGDRVPADARILSSFNLKLDEAALTGESVPVEKSDRTIAEKNVSVGDRLNMIHAGTSVTYGRGVAVVVATAMKTEFGQIAQLLSHVEKSKTPLQQNLDRVGSVLAKVALIVVAMIVAGGLLRGQPVMEMVIFGIALAVAVVPEALPAVVTISLALGVQRMVKRHALIRRLPAVETLGSTSIICSDKTGTLTKDEMTVRRLYVAGEFFDVTGAGYAPVGQLMQNESQVELTPQIRHLLEAGALASDATLAQSSVAGEGWKIRGDPTEGALVVAAAKMGLERSDLEREWPRLAEIPFSAETRRMTTFHQGAAGEGRVCVKGAPEIVLSACGFMQSSVGVSTLDGDAKTQVMHAAAEMASAALRVLAIAEKHCASIEEGSEGLTLLGLVGMIDPPRPEVLDAIARCRSAGIRVVMITGDHPATATAVAQELRILDQGRVVTGADLDAWNDDQLVAKLESVEVYARVSPAHKLRVVTALQAQGHVVAMTGDGVNDAPALRKADIGIAMGVSGTDVSREAAAMTLTDDSFASIVAAVDEGRQVFGNIKKYLMYLLSSNIGEIGLMAGTAVLGLPLPLTAVQILYVNLATDGLPALALAVDPPESDLMRRRPRDPRRGIFTRPVVLLMILGGLWSTLVNVSLFAWALKGGRSIDEAMTMTFVSLVLIQFIKAYNYRSDRNSILQAPFANRWLNLSVGWELILLVALIYVPFFQRLFGTYALPAIDWIIVAAASVSIAPVLELAKWAERKGWFGAID